MGSFSNESIEDFLNSIKQAGVEITNERELRERMEEAHLWRSAFRTLVVNGRALGIRLMPSAKGSDESLLRRTLQQFQFPEGSDTVVCASIKA